MKRFVACLLLLPFLLVPKIQAQFDDLGACSCGYQFASVCCGCGMAKPIRGYDCVNTCAPEGCCCSSSCTWEDWGSCAPTSNAACQCATPPPTPPAGGYTCEADCHAVSSNCGEVGKDPANGTCPAGQLCCKAKGTGPIDNCCYDGAWADANAGGNCDNDTEWTDGWYACNADHSCDRCRCYPSCSPRCGQADGCGGTCGTQDDGAPAAPAITTPAANGVYLQVDATGKVAIVWNATAKSEYYQVELHPSTDPAQTPGTTTNVYATWWSFTPASRYYSVRVRGINTSCGTDGGTWSAYRNFQVLTPISGHIYYDQNGIAGLSGGICTGPTTVVPTEAGDLTITGTTVDGYVGGAMASYGSYTMYLPHTTNSSLQANLYIGNSAQWLCSCPAGCSYPSGINSPQANVNFYVLNATDPWWQVEGGPVSVYGTTGTVLRSLISPYCLPPACEPSLIRNQNGSNTEGYVLTGGGDIDTSFLGGKQTNQIDQNRHSWFAKMNKTPAREDYGYFYKLLQLPASPESDFGASANNAAKPTGTKANPGAEAYFHSGDLVIGQAWDISADEIVFVVVDGNVEVSAPTSVAKGGFFMIAASGNITFGAQLGHDNPDATGAIVEGVFVADGQIRLPSRGTSAGGDKKFVGEGTFVGWSGFALERDYDDGQGRRRLNNNAPVEYFRYRPDFLQNAPAIIKRAKQTWREVNP